LIHINTDKPQESIKHIYLGQARSLRPDLSD
jgi:chorismate mutase